MYVLRGTLPKQGNRLKMKKSAMLMISLVLLYLFVAVGLPFLSQLAGFTEEHQVIIDEKIEAGAWFYIFVEKINGDIEPRVRHTMQFTPGMQKADQ